MANPACFAFGVSESEQEPLVLVQDRELGTV